MYSWYMIPEILTKKPNLKRQLFSKYKRFRDRGDKSFVPNNFINSSFIH